LDEVLVSNNSTTTTSLPDMLHIVINIGENVIFMEEGKALGRMQKGERLWGCFTAYQPCD
jgi:hypothetical protein